MNIVKREMRAGLKAFFFWMLGMFVFSFVGIIKYQSYSGNGSMTQLLEAFPRVVLAVMGVAGVDIDTLPGYTAVLFYYVRICAAIYAIHLGASAVSRESIDKTYEFIFTKPRSRAHVLGMKLTAAYIYLALFSACNVVFTRMAFAYLKADESVASPELLALSVFILGCLFLALAAFFASLAKKPEKGALFGNLAFLYAFILGVVYNMLEKPGLLKLAAPFNYFDPADLIAGRLDGFYAALTLLLTAAFLIGAFRFFKKRDLT